MLRTQQTKKEKKNSQGIRLEFRADCPTDKEMRERGKGSYQSTLINRPHSHSPLSITATPYGGWGLFGLVLFCFSCFPWLQSEKQGQLYWQGKCLRTGAHLVTWRMECKFGPQSLHLKTPCFGWDREAGWTTPFSASLCWEFRVARQRW